jgi:hypothetical protein
MTKGFDIPALSLRGQRPATIGESHGAAQPVEERPFLNLAADFVRRGVGSARNESRLRDLNPSGVE